MSINLINQSRMWHEEADKLLEDSHLCAVLSNIGEVKITGSYDYGLMLGADIDIYVIISTKTAKAAALKALGELIEQNYWNGYLFYDFANHSSKYHPSFPKSYYVGVKADYGKHRWKVDMWFGEDEILNHNNDWIKQLLNDETRGIILKLKKARNGGRFKADSHQIYDAVLRHGIKNIEDFEDWIMPKRSR